MAEAIWRQFKRVMPSFTRSMVFLIFFLPLMASLFYLFKATDSLFYEANILSSYWTPYVEKASLITFIVGLVSVLLTVKISFYIGYCIFCFRKTKIEKIVALFLSVPHLAFFSGTLFLISSSGLISRIFNIFSDNTLYGLDHDPWGLSFAVTLAFKESLFLLFVMLPVVFNRKNEVELIVVQSFGRSDFAYWTHVLWPRVLVSIRYPIWMITAFSVGIVDLGIVLGPTNPPPFSLVLWEFFRDPNSDNQFKSLVGSFHLVAILCMVILTWEIFLWIFLRALKMKIYWNTKSLFSIPKKFFLTTYFVAQLIPVVILSLWAFTEEWIFPNLFPTSFTVSNFQSGFESIFPTVITTIGLGFLAAGISTIVCLTWFEWDRLSLKPWIIFPILFVPIFPILPLLFGFDVFISSDPRPSPFLSVLYVHTFLVFPYVFLILKPHFYNFDERYKFVALSFGRSIWSFLLKIRLQMLLRGILTAFSVGFAVSVSQYVSTIFIGSGRVETLTTQMVVAASGENRKWIGVFGLIQIILPALIFLISQSLGKEKE